MPTPILKLLHAATPDTPDSELLARFASARDEVAFTELVRRHGPAVYRVSRRLAPACADDAFQATFLVLACRAGSVRKAASVGSWLIGVAGRVARQMARRERRPLAPSHRGATPQAAEPDRLVTAELAAVLDDELTRLPDHYRAPVVLCLVNGRTQEQAAAELGNSVRTLRRRLEHAKALLRLRLERRGVVPAVAAGLVASAGAASAVPVELQQCAVRGVFEFLTGGAASSPAAVVAKGVVGDMATMKTTALVATAAAVMIGLGIGAAQPPATTPPPELPRPMPLKLPVDPRPIAAAPVGRLDASSVHRSSNFLVIAPTAVVARAVAAEAEFQREEIGKRWLPAPQAAWAKRCEIRVSITGAAAGGSTTFEFGKDTGGRPACNSAVMQLSGTFESVLSNSLPHEVTHAVLAYHVGKPLPRWADEGIAILSETPEEQARHDVKARELLNAGRGIRLSRLFRMTEYPRDTLILYAQGHSVVRFLHVWAIDRSQKPPAAIVEFVQKGMDGNTAESWDKAAKDVFGFADVDAMQAQWLAWLATPRSQLGGPKMPAAPPNDADPTLIPPTTLPGGDRPEAGIYLGRPGEEVLFVSARKFELPVAFGRAKNPKGENIALYASRDRGATWRLHGVLPLDKMTFAYEAAADGEYWFHLVVTGAGRPVSMDPADQTTHVKVFVDTIPPEILVKQVEKGVEWETTDANLDPASITLQAKRADGKEWQAITSRKMKVNDCYRWQLSRGDALQVRVLAKDRAGNETTSSVVTVE